MGGAYGGAIGAGGVEHTLTRDEVTSQTLGYEAYHSVHGGDKKARLASYDDMVNKYYDLVTDFYEYGWGTSFHFAPQLKDETYREAIRRHEHYLAARIGAKEGQHVIDLGCGIGGPLREIAKFTGASVTGVTLNAYQVKRAEMYNKKGGWDQKGCSVIQGNFMKLPFKEGTIDGAYAIEATCHAPDPTACYAEALRVLKPGSKFATYEWVYTDKYNKDDPEHRKAGDLIEIGNGLPDIRTAEQCAAAMREAGFVDVEWEDLALKAEIPWYDPIVPYFFSIKNFKTSFLGRLMTTNLVRALEILRIAPKGSGKVQKFLEQGADGLVKGGQLGIFTPSLFLVGTKPLDGAATPSRSAQTKVRSIPSKTPESSRAKSPAPSRRT